ncbi:MAG: PcfJ domain-containing protein [Bariatricus sp.]
MEKKNILQSDEDIERIKKYCGTTIWNEKRWWEYIERFQSNIATDARNKARERKYQKRQQELKDRIEHTEPLPEKKILEIADRRYFLESHYLYYKKHGCWAAIACSKCGGVTDARWKAGISYESEFQRWTEEPREGHFGTCPLCGARGEYKCQGKVKGSHSKTVHLFLGQKYKDHGMVMRYVEISKTWRLELICGEEGPEMFNASEELSGVEIARAYFEPGKKNQIDYHKHNYYSGEDFWDDCNLCGLANITIKSAPILAETYEEMKGTMFQYSALQEYVKEVGEVNPIDYFERYQQTPQIEMLVKLGLIGIVGELVKCRYGIVACETAKSPDQFLGIRKERVKQLIAMRGDVDLLETMKMECRMNQVWTDEQIQDVAETRLRRGQIEMATEYMTLQKLLNRIKKYAGCEYGTGCTSVTERIRQTAVLYVDYLNMRKDLGYDLRNTVYQQPRSLRDAHGKMVMESSKGEMDKRLQEVKAKFQNIRRNYRRFRKQYFYEDDRYLIRPARSAEEIVMEGRILHHCVGGDGYLKKHNEGKTYILMLRDKRDKEVPFITVEIDGERNRIIQWYGSHDKKPDSKNMQKWLDEYVMRLNSEAVEEQKIAIA